MRRDQRFMGRDRQFHSPMAESHGEPTTTAPYIMLFPATAPEKREPTLNGSFRSVLWVGPPNRASTDRHQEHPATASLQRGVIQKLSCFGRYKRPQPQRRDEKTTRARATHPIQCSVPPLHRSESPRAICLVLLLVTHTPTQSGEPLGSQWAFSPATPRCITIARDSEI